MFKLRTMILAAALALSAGGTAIAAQAPEPQQARAYNARSVGNQVALDAVGKQHDPARFARLMALLQSPQLTVLNVERWAEAHRGGGAGMGLPPTQDLPLPQPMPFQPQTHGAPKSGAMAPVVSMPSFAITPAASVIGEDKAARERFVQALFARRAYILDMRNRLLGTRSLRDSGVPIDEVIGVDVLPGSGNLEIFTVPQ